MQDDYPRHDLVAFCALVQKALTKKSERTGKRTRFHVARIINFGKPPHKE